MNDPLWAEFNKRFNSLAAGFGGRPFLNQTKHLTKAIVHESLGPDWERFLATSRTRDPDGRFLSAYFQELM